MCTNYRLTSIMASDKSTTWNVDVAEALLIILTMTNCISGILYSLTEWKLQKVMKIRLWYLKTEPKTTRKSVPPPSLRKGQLEYMSTCVSLLVRTNKMYKNAFTPLFPDYGPPSTIRLITSSLVLTCETPLLPQQGWPIWTIEKEVSTSFLCQG